MPGQAEREGHARSNILPFQGKSSADLSLTPLPIHELNASVTPQVEHMWQMARDAKECFPLHAGKGIRPKVLIADKARKTRYYANAQEYLSEQGVSPEEMDELFTERGQLRLEGNGIRGIYDHSAAVVDSVLKELFAPINRIIDRSLDGISSEGFNKHGEVHSNRVVRQEVVLLDYVGADESTKKNAIIAGRAHDIGCALAREPHAYVSQPMLARMVPSIKDDPENYRKISRAILFHDSDTLGGVVAGWGNISAEERLQKLANYMNPEGLALLIADKVEIGRDRISDKILAENIVRDPHAVVNLLGRHDRIEPLGDSLVWRLKYNPDFTPKEMEKFKHFAPGWKRRHDEGEINVQFYDWQKMFWGIYTDRAITLAESALAFFPFLGNVEIEMMEARTGEESKPTIIRRDSLDKDIMGLKQQQNDFIKSGVLKYRS